MTIVLIQYIAINIHQTTNNTVHIARSLSKVWHMDNVKYYTSKKAQGKPLPYAREEDDPLQMGGDFTFRWVQIVR